MARTPLKKTRPEKGRALFYSRDSGGKHDQTPSQYILWAKSKADGLGLLFGGTPEGIERQIESNDPHLGDVFFDNSVSGNLLSRPALNALKAEIRRDPTVSHVFIPRRDRLARPDHAMDGVILEKELRETGITLVFMNHELPPLRRGQRQDIGEAITAYCDYQQSGTFRDELAEKMIFAQRQLAQRGFSTGGRASFGFRRNLINGDGVVIRQLSDGEIVRQKGHHVVLLPGPPEELKLIRRILGMLEKTPACRVAQILNAEGIPSPDAGRKRKDNGVTHNVSGVWHSSTITSIARNPLIRAMTSYGRRSMGDRCRTSLEGPRQLDASDYGANEKPKVIQNPESQQVMAPAHGSPLIPLEQSERLLEILNKRAGTQKGKPRSRDPQRNPLGGRVFDVACAWPMYRVPRSGSFAYTCGFYQQTHGQCCSHNQINGPTVTRFALAAVRQFLFKPGMLNRLEAKLRSKSKSVSAAPSKIGVELTDKRIELEKINGQLTTVKRNLSLAENQETLKAIESFFVELQTQRTELEKDIAQLETKSPPRHTTPEEQIQAALAQVEALPKLADASANLAAIGELFQRINLQMFLRFQPIKKTKRVVNHLSGGVLTIGAAPAPIEKYAGPTGRRALQSSLAYNEKCPLREPSGQMSSLDSGETAESLGNVNRDDRI